MYVYIIFSQFVLIVMRFYFLCPEFIFNCYVCCILYYSDLKTAYLFLLPHIKYLYQILTLLYIFLSLSPHSFYHSSVAYRCRQPIAFSLPHIRIQHFRRFDVWCWEAFNITLYCFILLKSLFLLCSVLILAEALLRIVSDSSRLENGWINEKVSVGITGPRTVQLS